jgi:hypothetical protein
LEPFWRRVGFQPVTGAAARFRWKEIGEAKEFDHALDFWARPLESA